MICDYDYVASLCCRAYAKKQRTRSQHERLVQEVLDACGKAGLPISYGLVEYFTHLAGTMDGIKMYIPVILANICYVAIYDSVPSILQDAENHAWVGSHTYGADIMLPGQHELSRYRNIPMYAQPLATILGHMIQVMLWEGDEEIWIKRSQRDTSSSVYEHWSDDAETLSHVREASWCHSATLLYLENIESGVKEETVKHVLPRLLTQWCVENRIHLCNKNACIELKPIWKDLNNSQGSEYRRLCDSVFGTTRITGKHRGEDFAIEIPFHEYLNLADKSPGNNSVFVIDSMGMTAGQHLDIYKAVTGFSFAGRGGGQSVVGNPIVVNVNWNGDDDNDAVCRAPKSSTDVPVTARTKPKSVPGQNREKPWLSKTRKKF